MESDASGDGKNAPNQRTISKEMLKSKQKGGCGNALYINLKPTGVLEEVRRCRRLIRSNCVRVVGPDRKSTVVQCALGSKRAVGQHIIFYIMNWALPPKTLIVSTTKWRSRQPLRFVLLDFLQLFLHLFSQFERKRARMCHTQKKMASSANFIEDCRECRSSTSLCATALHRDKCPTSRHLLDICTQTLPGRSSEPWGPF